jgi:non-ribosomal peptide synthetase component E (peptide arylation enzyme)
VAGDQHLVAYVACAAPRPEATVLREHVRGRLPHYMVPNAVVVMEALPLTPNGKIDRQALPAPAMARQDGEVGYRPPRTAVESALGSIWEEVLQRERVGRLDSFFEIGGHSLSATQVASRVRERLGVALPLREIFEAPTLAELAERVESLRWAAESRPVLPPGEDRREEGEL